MTDRLPRGNMFYTIKHVARITIYRGLSTCVHLSHFLLVVLWRINRSGKGNVIYTYTTL